MLFKGISYLELWQPFCSVECYHLCNLVEGIKMRNYFEFGSVVKEMSFKRFLNWSSGHPPVRWSGTIYAILKEGIMGNIHVK